MNRDLVSYVSQSSKTLIITKIIRIEIEANTIKKRLIFLVKFGLNTPNVVKYRNTTGQLKKCYIAGGHVALYTVGRIKNTDIKKKST